MVGVVGTGSSAVQIVPKIVNQVSQITIFQRTPGWVFPYFLNKEYDQEEIAYLWLAYESHYGVTKRNSPQQGVFV
jgi:cation diffusion facilitator CzcD-associated flavoprotein CzcO